MFYYIAEVGQRMGLGSFVHSQYPMAAFIPFALWLFLNLALKRLWPRIALHRGELLTIFAMTWVVGTIPQLGWVTYWTTSMALPAYYARPENQYAEILFEPASLARISRSFTARDRHLLARPARGDALALGWLVGSNGSVAGRVHGHGDFWLLPLPALPTPVGRSRETHLSPGASASGLDARF